MDALLLFLSLNRTKILVGVLLLALAVGGANWGVAACRQRNLRREHERHTAARVQREKADRASQRAADSVYHNLQGQLQAEQPRLDSLRRLDENLTRRLPALPSWPARP